ncbi:DUF6382 domain-containing protein [Oribacterium sp. FC2011]|uniref:DUF6382 domain-containing protein n=1 Tax=Oribacterium sp. FC2011 TaxID=1408311 RepID=UPI0004E126F1|nr:DUF6382 domain-containing protein [Oribacterium sp. FC2011]
MEKNISFEHSLTHSFMNIRNMDISPEAYETKLLKETPVPGALPLVYEHSPEGTILSYNVTGLEPMNSLFETKALSHLDISVFMECLNDFLSSLEEYMISENSVFLSPSSVFYNPDNNKWLFTLIPAYDNVFRDELTELLTYVLKHIDYEDDRAVIIGYSLFQETGKEFYQLTDLMRIVRTNIEKENEIKNAAVENPKKHPGLISQDGIFRPVDAGIILNNTGKDSSSTLTYSNEACEDTEFMKLKAQLKGEKYEGVSGSSSDRIPLSSVSSYPETGTGNISFPSDYGKDKYPNNDLSQSVEVRNLAEPEDAKLFGIFTFPQIHKSKENRKTETLQNEATIKDRLDSKSGDNSLKGKILLSVLLMILIPSLVWFLKGAFVFRKTLPLIMALEVGLSLMILLDLIMHKMPDEAQVA